MCGLLHLHTLSRNSPSGPIQIEFAPLRLAELYVVSKGEQHQRQRDQRSPLASRSACLLRDG